VCVVTSSEQPMRAVFVIHAGLPGQEEDKEAEAKVAEEVEVKAEGEEAEVVYGDPEVEEAGTLLHPHLQAP